MTVRGCGTSCTPGDTTATLSGLIYPTTIECCTTDECNSSKILKSFTLLNFLNLIITLFVFKSFN